MAHGDVAVRSDGETLYRTETGTLVSTRPTCGPVAAPEIFSTREMSALDDAIAEAEHASGLRFAAYLGDLGENSRAGAESLLGVFGDNSPYTVLIAISPGQRIVEIVTGTEAALRISDRGARVAALAAVASCRDSDLHGAFLNAIRILADHAGEITEIAGW